MFHIEIGKVESGGAESFNPCIIALLLYWFVGNAAQKTVESFQFSGIVYNLYVEETLEDAHRMFHINFLG